MRPKSSMVGPGLDILVFEAYGTMFEAGDRTATRGELFVLLAYNTSKYNIPVANHGAPLISFLPFLIQADEQMLKLGCQPGSLCSYL